MGRQLTVAHYVDTFLWAHGTWVYPQLLQLRRYRAIALCRKTCNLDAFPFEPIYAYLDDVRTPIQFWDRICRKLCRHSIYPGYFYRTLLEEHAVLIHSHFGPGGVVMFPFACRLYIPLITAFCGYDVSYLARDPFWLSKYQQLFREGEAFLVEGSFMKETLVKLGCPSDKVIVQHLGVDLTRFQYKCRKLSHGESVQILIAAAFTEKKGTEYALRAFAQVYRQYL